MRELDLDDAKRLTVGIKRALPNDLPISVEIMAVVESGGEHLTLKIEGNPPFLKIHVHEPNGTVSTFLGHPPEGEIEIG